MNFDELLVADRKAKAALSANDESFDSVRENLDAFDRSMRRNLVAEFLVAVFSFGFCLSLLAGGQAWYARIIENLMPALYASHAPELNVAMYASLLLMTAYCVFVPFKRYRAQRRDVSFSWSLSSRVDSEVERMERQSRLWNAAHLWSILPAAIIGVLFFWGLNKSLSGSWIPSLYLYVYFVFVALSTVGALYLKQNLVSRQLQPVLEGLYAIRADINR